MQCPRCQHENHPQAKFCEECGEPLAHACPNCGTQVSAATAPDLPLGCALVDKNVVFDKNRVSPAAQGKAGKPDPIPCNQSE